MSKIDQKLIEMRNGFDAVSQAVEAIANSKPQMPEILDRSLSGNKISGGRIAHFASAGIKDTAKDTVLTVNDDGISVATVRTKSIPNALTVGGDLTVDGTITATKLHVNELVADVRNERTTNLEFKAENNSVSNKGIVWTGEGQTRQLTMQSDRLFSSQSIDIFKEKDYRIGNKVVLNATTLGQEIVNSSLRTVGTLNGLAVNGNVVVDNFVYYDSDTMRLGIGHDAPNGALSIGSLENEFVIDHDEVGDFKLGTWTTSELSIITDDTCRIHLGPTGGVTLHDKVNVKGKLGINVNNFNDDADITTAGPIRMQGKKMQVGTSTPTEGSYRAGDVVWNSNPKPTGYVGWICVREGAPGEWKPFGQISA